nr:remorin 4.1-like [Ipomoea batatas]
MVVRSTNVRDMGTEMTRDGSRELSRTATIVGYKREEAKIQAWEDDERRKAEMEMQRIGVVSTLFIASKG